MSNNEPRLSEADEEAIHRYRPFSSSLQSVPQLHFDELQNDRI